MISWQEGVLYPWGSESCFSYSLGQQEENPWEFPQDVPPHQDEAYPP